MAKKPDIIDRVMDHIEQPEELCKMVYDAIGIEQHYPGSTGVTQRSIDEYNMRMQDFLQMLRSEVELDTGEEMESEEEANDFDWPEPDEFVSPHLVRDLVEERPVESRVQAVPDDKAAIEEAPAKAALTDGKEAPPSS